MTKYQEKVLAAVKALGGKSTCMKIATAILSNPVTVATAARRLEKDGKVTVTDERENGYVRVFVTATEPQQ